MNILITGLTLHNNKGGPALALSLINLLNRYFINAKYYMAVPSINNSIKEEEKWARIYNIDKVFGRIGIYQMLPPYYFKAKNRNRVKIFLNILDKIDLVVDLTALSYMDFPNKSFLDNLQWNLSNYLNRYLSKKKGVKFIRWTQSYGPFLYHITKQIVKKDLKSQEIIFTRGKISYKYMKGIFPYKNIYSFPDIAITLPLKQDYLKILNISKRYITISPSSVIYSIKGKQHINEIVKLIETIQKRYQILLVPHNLRKVNPNLNNCDLKICEYINSLLSNKVIIISEDLDVYNLKGIISKAYIHIGARYHSVVAALSTGVPCISISWHDKYKDIMNMYNVGEFVFNTNNIDIVIDMIKNIENNYIALKNILIKRQVILNKKIDENLKLFTEMYEKM
jgi:colanic acid/amylovoran biosynthesis protein